MKQLITYVAFDGEKFETADECKAYEANNFAVRLVGLTIEQVKDALSREDAELADAFEKAGNQIAKARRESGEFKRTRKGGADSAHVPAHTADQTDEPFAPGGDEAEEVDEAA